MLEVEASFDFPWNFFFLREQILDLLQPMVGRAKSQKKGSIWLFGIWC